MPAKSTVEAVRTPELPTQSAPAQVHFVEIRVPISSPIATAPTQVTPSTPAVLTTITPSPVATPRSSSPLSTSLIIPYSDKSSNAFAPNVPASLLVLDQQGFTNNVFTPVNQTTDIDNVFENNNSVFEQENNIRDSDWVAPAINIDELII